jgi:CRISPR system Cascade subunit CasC
MKLIELHILQSFPVSCLNRDDLGSPKSATFGGVQRARISSQCLKRATREMAHDFCPSLFMGQRSRLIVEPLIAAIKKAGIDDATKAGEAAKTFCSAIATWDEKAEKKEVKKVKTMTFFSAAEIEEIGTEIAKILLSDEKKPEDKIKKAASACAKVGLKDAADIALFGRMVASDHSLTLEGAALFSHALSTHKSSNEIDFWTAVDDRQKEDDTVSDEDKAGSGGMGTLEFNSALYYRYAAINLDLLADADHLAGLTPEQRKEVVDAFIRATLLAVPSARKNSMNAQNPPVFVLGIVKDKGQPVQLINAFESPVKPERGGGYIAASIETLNKHHESLKTTWGIQTAAELSIPTIGLDEFCKGIVAHVL